MLKDASNANNAIAKKLKLC